MQILSKIHNKIMLCAHSKSTRGSLILLAVILFILINIGCSLFGRVQEQQTRAYISCDSLAKTFKAAQPRPNMILLGSSLMRMPFFLSDRMHTDYVSDYEHYCWGRTLQNILRTAGMKNSQVFNFSIDGEMVSDAFLINKKLFRGASAPEWIVYGIAPRDFIDSLLSNETRTPIFDCLFTLGDAWSANNGFTMTLEEKLNFTVEKLCFFYDKRKQIQNMLSNWCSSVLADALCGNGRSHNPPEKMVQTLEPWQDPYAWRNSIEEYHKRYKLFNASQCDKQQRFLKSLCEQARKRGSKLLLVNMPLTRENIALIPSEAYKKYQNIIATAAQWEGVQLLDLQNANVFSNNLYRDTVHLNEKGAHYLSMIISDTLRTASNVSSNSFAAERQTIDGLSSWWLAKAYFAGPMPPDIVVLGSDQLGALQGADAYVYNSLIDPTGDHRSRVLEHDFYGLLNKNWKVLIGALPAAMISDQFFISRALFSDQYKPKLVVLTFSPKDFIDQYCAFPASTEAFAFFSNYTNCRDSILLRKSIQNKCAEYNNSHNTDKFYSSAMSPLCLGRPFERLCRGEILISSGDGYVFHDNSKDYYSRLYKDPFLPQFKVQLHYLDSLLAYLKQRQIKVVTFGLPLTTNNQNILPKTFWTLYDQQVGKVCKKYDADWININREVKGFNDNEFVDGIHLNLKGGLRLSSTIALFTANKFHWRTFAELQNDERKMF